MKTPRSLQPRSLFATALCLTATFLNLLAVPAADAAVRYWSGDGASQGGPGTWNTTLTRWGSAATGPYSLAWVNANNDTAEFNVATGTITLGANVTVGGINEKTGASGNTISEGSGPFTLTLGAASVFNTAASTTAGRTLVLNVSIVGAAANSLTLTGPSASGNGNILFNRANTYSGGTSFSGNSSGANNLTLGHQNALQNTTLTLSSACNSLIFDSSVSGNAFTFGGLAAASAGAGRDFALQNNAGTPAAIALSVGNNNAGTTYAGVMSGAGSFIKIGTGAMTNSGANTYSGTTTVSAGILALGNALAMQNSVLDTTASVAGGVAAGLRTTVTTLTLGGLSGNKNFAASGGVFATTVGGYGSVTALTLNPGVGVSASYSGVIANGAAGMTLTMSGTGTQVLSGISTYSGNTTINAGRLQGVTGGSLASPTVTLNSATATNSVSITDNTKAWTNAAFTAAAAATGVLEFDFGAVTPSASVAPYEITGAATFTATPSVRVVSSSGLAVGTYPLMKWGSGGAGAPTAVTLSPQVGGTTASLNVSGNVLNLVIASNVKANNTLPLNNPASWTSTLPSSGDLATWDNTVTGNNATILGADTTWAGIQIKNPGGLVTINAGNTLTNNSTIDLSAATANLVLNCDVALGAANVWDVAASRTLTVGGVVSGSSALTLQGAGTNILTGANTYSGATTVGNGTTILGGNRLATSASGVITVGTTIGNTATLFITNGAYALGANQFNVGNGAGVGVAGIVNQTAGSVSFTGGNALLVGGLASGTYNLSGGSVNGFSSSTRGVILGVNSDSIANFNLSGSGSLNLGSGILQVGRTDSSTGVNNTTNNFNQTGGSATVLTLALGGRSAAPVSTNIISSFGVTGGTFAATNFTFIAAGVNNVTTMTIGGTGDVTLPAFPTAIGAGSSATISFDGGTLRSAAASASYLSGLTAAYIKSGGARFNTGNGSITVAQALLTDPVSTGGGLTKDGANTLTLTTAPTYTGPTVVNAGKLEVPSTHVGNGAATVSANATLAVTASGTSQWQPTSLTLANPCTLEFSSVQNPGSGTAPLAPANAIGAVSGVTININSISGSVAVGNRFPLLGNAGSTSGYTVGTQPASIGVSGHLEVDSGTLVYVVDVIPDIWAGTDGVNPTYWDILTTINWAGKASLNTPAGSFANNDVVQFDDTATPASPVTVDIQQAVTPGNIIVANSSKAYIITNSSGTAGIGGSGTLTKSGSGTVTLASPNSYTGATTISGGVVKVRNASALGTTAGGTTVSGTVSGAATNARLDLEGDVTVTGEALTIRGNGDFFGALNSRSGSNIWAGPVTVDLASTRIGAAVAGATLVVNGVIDSGANAYGLQIRSLGVNTATVILKGANTYLGDTTNYGGNLKLDGGNNRLPVGAKFFSGTSTDVAQFDLNGNNQEVAGLAVLSGATAANNSITNSSATLSMLTVNAATPSTWGGVIAGNLALTKIGTSTLTLSATNTYTGSTTVSNGILELTRPALISSTVVFVPTNGTLLFNPSGAVWLNGHINPPINLNGGTLSNYTAGNFYTVLNNLNTGSVTVNNASTIGMYQAIANAGTTTTSGGLYFDGGLKGSAPLTVNADISGAPVALVLRTTNSTYTGTMTVNGVASAITNIGSGLAVGSTGTQSPNLTNVVALPNASITVNGTLALGYANSPDMSWAASGSLSQPGITGTTFAMDALNGPGVVVANFSIAGGTRTLSVGNNNGSGSFSGVIAAGVNSTLSLIKNGNGTQTLSGTNTYTGTTTIAGGTLTISGLGSLGGGVYAGNITNAGVFNFASATSQTNSGVISDVGTLTISGNLTLSGNNTYTGGTTIGNGGVLQIGAGSTSGSIAGTAGVTNNGTIIYNRSDSLSVPYVISGTGGLTKTGAGTLTLNLANSYAGATRVNQGTLVVNVASINTASTVSVSNAAVLQLNFSTTNTVGALVLNGISQPAGVYNSVNAAPYLTGTGSLKVASAGPSGPATLTNSFSGNTLSLSWPAGQGWRLQQQTNALTVGLSTNWTYLTDSSVSSTNLTINPALPTVFYRLAYP